LQKQRSGVGKIGVTENPLQKKLRQCKNGSDAICYAEATVSRSVLLMVKHLTKKRAATQKK